MMTEFCMRDERFDLPNPISASIDTSIRGWLLNISHSGCLVVTHRWMQIGDALHEFTFKHAKAQDLSVSGKIVRANLIPHGNTVIYEIGVSFSSASMGQVQLDELLSPTNENAVPIGNLCRTRLAFAF